jgi:hypothetical protein
MWRRTAAGETVTPVVYDDGMPKRAEIRAVGELAASRHGAFNMRQAAELGLTRVDITRMQRSGLIEPVHRNVWRFIGHPITARQSVAAATLAAHVVASHFSAAELHGLDGVSNRPRQPEVLSHHGQPARIEGVLVRRTRSLPNGDIITVDNIPCTTLARTACDLASLIDPQALVRIIDDIQRRGSSMLWLIERALRLQRTGRSGPTQVLDVARRRLGGYRVPDSWFERLIEQCLESPLLSSIVRQHTLLDDAGEFVARFDLAVPWARLGIEGHSRSYHLGELVECYDEDRDIRSAKQGWEIAYLGFAATRSPAAVCRDIEAVVQRRMIDLGLTPPL